MPGIISTTLPNQKPVHRKLVIKKIEKPDSLLVSFSKRKGGLFRKACQLCGLCGAEVAVIVFSPRAGRLFVFGHPSADTVLSRLEPTNTALHGRQYISMYASSEDEDHDTDSSIMESNSIESCTVSETSIDLESLESLGLDLEIDTEEMEEDEASRFWWDQPIENMKKLDELKQFKSSLEKLKTKVSKQLDEMAMRKLVVRHYLM